MKENWEESRLGILATSLVVLWLRLYAPEAGALSSMPGQGAISHMPQLKQKSPSFHIEDQKPHVL